METLDQLIDRRTPIDSSASCAEALDRFIREPDAHALAVVEGARPVGILVRDSFLARMENPETANLAVRQVFDPDPLIAEVSSGLDGFLEDALANAPAGLLSGFIAVEGGRYVGVGTAVSILAAKAGKAQRRAEIAGFMSRLGDELAMPVGDIMAAVVRLRHLRLGTDATIQLDAIDAHTRAALELLANAALLQKAELGQLDPQPARRRIQLLMDEVEANWRHRAEAAGVTLLCSYDGDPECVATVDAGWFHQMLDALIEHALLHASSGVIEASVRTRRADTDVVIEGRVRENASMHTPAYLKGLFNPLMSRTEPGEMGVALSLALAGRRIHALGGTILAEPNVGAGATVAFSFTTHEAAESAETAPAAPARRTRKAHVLIVDDNATNRMVVEALCEMYDFSSESVIDGYEAVEAARDGRFDIVLMDIKMPRMDGVTATREIRALPGAPGEVPIIALTANADPEDVRTYLATGMRTVIEKPIKPERLRDAINEALAEHAARTGAAGAAAAA